MAKVVTDIVEKQIRAWSRQNSLNTTAKKVNAIYPVITISREFGSPGAAFAHFLGEKIGFKVWDQELLKMIAEDLGSDHEFVKRLDERREQAIEDAVAGFLTNVHTNVNYRSSLIRVVNTIEQFGRSIIVGRGANYISENPLALHVRLVGPLKNRIEEWAKRESISIDESARTVEQMDLERTEFIRSNFHKDVSDPAYYDIVLNSATFSLEQMAEMILKAYEEKTRMRTDKKNLREKRVS